MKRSHPNSKPLVKHKQQKQIYEQSVNNRSLFHNVLVILKCTITNFDSCFPVHYSRGNLCISLCSVFPHQNSNPIVCINILNSCLSTFTGQRCLMLNGFVPLSGKFSANPLILMRVRVQLQRRKISFQNPRRLIKYKM